MPLAPPLLVVGAARQPLPYGLFSAFSLRPGGDRWEGGVAFETETCDPVEGISAADCTPEQAEIGLPKDLDSNTGQDGAATPFSVYGHFSCSPVGYGTAGAQARATAHLLAREEARVEQALWTGDLGNEPHLAQGASVEVVMAAAGDPVTGLGLVENEIATSYGSLGVVHMTRAAATVLLARDSLIATGARLTTRLGTPVVAGGGYPGTGPTGQAAAAGTSWIFGSPALFGYRSDVFTSSNNPGDLFDRGRNQLYAVAERTYLVGFDPCGVTAALVDLP